MLIGTSISVVWALILGTTLTTLVNGDLSRLLHLKDEHVAVGRDGKLLFSFVRFPNEKCGSATNVGTCYTKSECKKLRGTNVGSCAKGYGACCKVTMTGVGDIRINNTLVVNPKYPLFDTTAQTNNYKVVFDDTPGVICQIRYDFEDMVLSPPTTTGICNHDKLVFNDDPKSIYFCGVAPDNYHWYVDTAGTTSPHTFSVMIDDTITLDRKYAIRVSQIPCDLGVPTKCGQYYTGTSGQIVSYNYNQDSYYLAGLSYSICFRQEVGYCTYTFKKTSDNQYIDLKDSLRFMMGNGVTTPSNPLLPGSAISCSRASTQQAQMFFSSNFCLYPDSMTSVHMTGPFAVTVKTEVDDSVNFNGLPVLAPSIISGFQFDWEHNKCLP